MYKFNHFHLTLFTSFFLFLTLNLNLSNAQSPMEPVPTYINHHSWEPSVAITVGAVIFALIVMAVISLYLRRCTDSHIIITTTTTTRVPCSCSHGITMELLNTFPTLFYSNIKHLSKDNQTLECAVCLTDFTDNDALRLLPKCNHVFHPHCIDSWLASHVTCPVCRANLSNDSLQVSITLQPDNNQEVSTTTEQTPTQIEPITSIDTNTNTNTNTNHCGSQVCVENPTFIGDNTTKSVCVTDEQQISSEIASVVELSSETNSDSITGNGGDRDGDDDGVGVVALERSLSRSNSTGHSLVEQGKGVERYTLRLPEDVRRYIFVNHGRTVERSSSVKEVCWSDSEESYTGKRVSGEVRVEKRWVICTPPFVARHG